MKYKCYYCDEIKLKELKSQNLHLDKKGKLIKLRSIDAENDSYIKYKDKYYHTDCFIEMETEKNKLTRREIDEVIASYLVYQDEEFKVKLSREKFFNWIKQHYQINLPPYFVMRIDDIAKGKDKKVFGKITYEELYEMYTMMINYLAKQILGKQFKDTSHRMNYELAIVLSKYENYRNYKDKLDNQNKEEIKIKEQMESSKKFEEVSTKVRRDNDDFYVADILDELI